MLRFRSCLLTAALLTVTAPLALAQTPTAAAAASATAAPFIVEYYYKTKWGGFEEFKALFRKNHYPVLMKEKALGRIVDVSIVYPTYHGTEDGRWDMRVTIVFKDAATAFAPFDNSAILKELYPNQMVFQREEQRRFELLDAHWDLPIRTENLRDW